jgi:hypothetical protein
VTAREQAEALRLGLIGGWATMPQVVAWADRLILEDRASEIPALLELCLLAPEAIADAVSLLGSVPGDRSQAQVGRYVAGLIYERLKAGDISTERAARALYVTTIDGYAPDLEFQEMAYTFDDRVDLALQGTYGTIQETRDEMLRYLERFAPNPLEN